MKIQILRMIPLFIIVCVVAARMPGFIYQAHAQSSSGDTGTSTSERPRPEQPRPRYEERTAYEFDPEDIWGEGKGPNNIFLKVDKIKNVKLLEMKKDFRTEMYQSLKLMR